MLNDFSLMIRGHLSLWANYVVNMLRFAATAAAAAAAGVVFIKLNLKQLWCDRMTCVRNDL